MPLVTLHDKTEIETFLRGNVPLHIYSLGDLDAFFWPYTQWYGFQQGGQLQAVALLYIALSPPVLLALAPPPALGALRALLTHLLPLLPKQVYTHLSLGVEDIFQPAYKLHSHGIHRKMILAYPAHLQNYYAPDVIRLTADHLPEIHTLYAESYPDHAFDPRMLETRQFFGLWRANRLVSIAGIHVYSPAYRVAAIGNVTTLPAFRNQGLGKAVVATVARSLLDSVDEIGLNVREDNRAALHTYQKLGFVVVDSYHEMMATPP